MCLAPRVRCRPIEAGDVDSLVDLLGAGFGRMPKSHWRRAFELLAAREVPDGYPRFGYMLDAEGAAVGVLLLIFRSLRGGVRDSIRCNVSSWYVNPAFGPYGWLLNLAAIKHREVTYVNVSPAAETWPVIEAQGFTCFSAGTFAAVPALAPPFTGVKVIRYEDDGARLASIEERSLLSDHVSYGCLSLTCIARRSSCPFVFRRRVVAGGALPAAQLIYSRSIEDVVRFAGPVGRFLARHGMLVVLIPADAPVQGLAGRYYADRPRMYYKGQNRPTAGDLSYTEAAMFGL